jgi:hypothetical protein
MLKQILIYLLLTIAVVLFAKYVHLLIVYIDIIYTYLHISIAPIFSKGGSGLFISKVVLLVVIPILLAGVPALVYRLIKGPDMPYFIEITWCFWLILVLSNIMIH